MAVNADLFELAIIGTIDEKGREKEKIRRKQKEKRRRRRHGIPYVTKFRSIEKIERKYDNANYRVYESRAFVLNDANTFGGPAAGIIFGRRFIIHRVHSRRDPSFTRRSRGNSQMTTTNSSYNNRVRAYLRLLSARVYTLARASSSASRPFARLTINNGPPSRRHRRCHSAVTIARSRQVLRLARARSLHP